jgi:thiol-disulfide isomerase/thioredoxin
MKRNTLMAMAATVAALLTMPVLGASTAEPPAVPPMKPGTARPALDFTTLKGEHPSWDSLKGKVVVVDFWASWCAPCIASFPKMNALQAQFAGKPVVFYSITYEKPGAVRGQLAQTPLETQVAIDNDFHTFESFNGWGIPTVYMFDRSGTLVATAHPDHFDAGAVQALLDGRVPSVPSARAWSDAKGAETYFRSLRDKQAN